MGQYWEFFNFDKCETFKSWHSFKLCDFFFEWEVSDSLLNLVIRPPSTSVVREEVEKIIGWKEPPGKCITTQWLSPRASDQLTLDKFPSELILIIFEHLELWEVVMLALTCSRFWILGQQRLWAVREQFIMFWTGCRISCLGDYAYDPPRAVNEVEYAERKTYERRNPRRVLYYFLKKASMPCEYPLRDVELRVVRTLLDRPKPASPVFRNHTKREYIREDIDMGREHVKCSFFGRVLLAYICWSSDPTTGMRYGDIIHGEWAGCRIDCVELQDLESALDGQPDGHDGDQEEQRPWKDITSAAYGLLHDIYKVEYDASEICCGYKIRKSWNRSKFISGH